MPQKVVDSLSDPPFVHRRHPMLTKFRKNLLTWYLLKTHNLEKPVNMGHFVNMGKRSNPAQKLLTFGTLC